MVVTAEGSILGDIANFDHEVNQVLNRKDAIVQNRVLRVDSLDEGPILVDELNVVRVDPEVGGEHQVEEELFTELCIVDGEAQLCKKGNGLTIHWEVVRVAEWERADSLEEQLDEGR